MATKFVEVLVIITIYLAKTIAEIVISLGALVEKIGGGGRGGGGGVWKKS